MVFRKAVRRVASFSGLYSMKRRWRISKGTSARFWVITTQWFPSVWQISIRQCGIVAASDPDGNSQALRAVFCPRYARRMSWR